MSDDLELEELMRSGLERQAAVADVTAPVVERARSVARRRRRGAMAVVAAAASVAAVVTVGVVVDSGDDPHPPAEDRGGEPLPAGWRTEYWRDLTVDVPADWGYGGAPVRSGRDLVACYPEAMVGPDGARIEGRPTLGYVGRPIMLTDVCALYPDIRPGGPEAPYVWLGADIEPGLVDLGNGYVQETVEVNGSTLTVATDDPRLRERILDSADGGEQCFSELAAPPSVPVEEDFGAPASGMLVCAYGEDEGGVIGLTYSAVLDDRAARAFESAYDRAPSLPAGRTCDLGDDVDWVVLIVEDRRYVVYTHGHGCPRVDGPVGPVRLSEELARPWAVGGIPATVSAGATTERDQWVYDYFIGPQG